ncbi:MAG: tetratricopeptide repeat protein [Marinobacterium sp.]|nr:tetratricopeptide repeat protein [Marinobacterium sp.]
MIFSELALAGMVDTRLDQARVLLRQERSDAAYNLLLTLEKSHGLSAEYNYLLGVASLQSEHFSQARSAFERTILLEPDNAGAHLDLAITEIELKNFRQADILLTQIEQKFAPPEGIRQVIRLYRNRIRQALQPRSQVSGNLFTTRGYSSNANNGTDRSLIELDLGDGPIVLPVGDSSKSSPDSYLDSGGTLNYSLSLGRWYNQLISALQLRNYDELRELDTTNILLGGSTRADFGRHQFEGGIFYSFVWLDGADYQSASTGSLQYSHLSRSGLRLGSQLRLHQTRYLQTPTNNTNQAELSLFASYPFTLHNSSNLLQLHMTANKGEATNNRAGGDEKRLRLAASWINQPAARHLLRLDGFIASDKDNAPYNDSFFGNEIRETNKYGLKIGYSYYFTPKLSVTISAAANRNRSTIDLFTTDSKTASIRLNYSFQ